MLFLNMTKKSVPKFLRQTNYQKRLTHQQMIKVGFVQGNLIHAQRVRDTQKRQPT